MVYVISPKPLEELQKVTANCPVKDKYKNPDYNAFYTTDNGKKFLSIEPLVMCCYNGKTECLESLAADIAWLGVWYNCPLYVYLMKDTYYFKELPLQYSKYRNFGKAHTAQEIVFAEGYSSPKLENLRVDNCYFDGCYEETQKAVVKVFEKLSLRESSCYGFLLTLNGFEHL